jgi:hypothetical protein
MEPPSTDSDEAWRAYWWAVALERGEEIASLERQLVKLREALRDTHAISVKALSGLYSVND